MSDDPHYEAGRQERMKLRKPRYARYELERLPIGQLKQLHRRPHAVVGCLERSDLIQRLVDDEQIQLIPTPQPVEYTLSYLQSLGVGKLKRCMADAGVFFRPEDVVEKKDMLEIFQSSGRLLLLPEEAETETSTEEQREEPASRSESTPSESEISEDNHRSVPQEKGSEEEEKKSDELSSSSSSKDRAATAHNSSTADSFISNGHLVETVHDEDETEASCINNQRPSPLEGDQPVQEMFSFAEGESELSSRQAAVESSTTAPTVHTRNSSGSNNDDDSPSSTIPDRTSTATSASVRSEPAVSTNVHVSAAASPMSPDQQPSPQLNASEPEIVDPVAAPNRNLSDSNSQDSDVEMEDAESAEIEEESSAHGLPPPHADVHTSRQSSYSSGPSSVSNNSDGSDPFRECTIARLQTIGQECNIDLSHCFERSEMIQAIRAGGVFDPVQLLLSEQTFAGWSVSQLRALASEVNVDLSDCSGRDDIIVRMLWKANNENSPQARSYIRALSPLAASSLKELRGIAREWQVDISDCLEKDEIIGRLIAARRPA